MWQERLSGVASLTNPAGCDQLVKATNSKANCQGSHNYIVDEKTLPFKHFRKWSHFLLEIFKDWRAVICPPFPGVWTSHKTRLYGLSSSFLGKNCLWLSFARFFKTWGLRKHGYRPECWSGEGLKWKDTKMGSRETENILTVALFKSGEKMLWILEETLFTALFLNQGGGHT